MGWFGKNGFTLVPVLCGILALAAFSCALAKDKQDGAVTVTQDDTRNAADYRAAAAAAGETAPSTGVNRDVLASSLENLTELERSGGFTQGMGIRESIIRENLGDYAGAVIAAYKELAWAYGTGLIDKNSMEQGLQNALKLGELPSQAAQGCLAFIRGDWAGAEAVLKKFDNDGEIDSVIRWMILCCTLEQNRGDKPAADSYRAIRGRYAKFPEYWYRGARVFSGTFSAEYAEYCLALAPSGPFAAECRSILAAGAGLNPSDSQALLSRPEIDQLVSQSVSQGNPGLLDKLMPLISLPDNSYTIYALGMLRSLAAVPMFRDHFQISSGHSSGRLAERLAYICQVSP